MHWSVISWIEQQPPKYKSNHPKKFLDTEVVTKNGKIETTVYRKSTKPPVAWSSNIPKHYKQNTVNADLHHSKQISTIFDKETYRIEKNFLAAEYLQKFVESVTRDLENDKVESVEYDYIIQPWFLEIAKSVIIVEVSFCTNNEISSKQFLRKFHNFTGSKFDLRIEWITRKTKALSELKDKCLDLAYKIYYGVYSCGETYLGETVRNVQTRGN